MAQRLIGSIRYNFNVEISFYHQNLFVNIELVIQEVFKSKKKKNTKKNTKKLRTVALSSLLTKRFFCENILIKYLFVFKIM